MGMPQRGTVHSIFNAAANIVFPGNFVLSLNALATFHFRPYVPACLLSSARNACTSKP
jgi:hypothetical protein